MRVLVVDDDEAGLHLISSIVRSGGHEVVTANDGIEALDTARVTKPDVVITDILMPRMDGYQLAREWKADPVLSTVPLIFLTASYTDPADEKFAVELGADGFLSKPVEVETLLETIECVVSNAESNRPGVPLQRAEEDTLREYSDRVVHKLEQKVADLERSNALLQDAIKSLGDEMEVKTRLIEQLGSQIEGTESVQGELHRERDVKRLILDTADVFICTTDVEGRLNLFSAGAELISGYSAQEVIGKDHIEIFAPAAERPRRRHLFQAVMESCGETTRLRNEWVMSRGSGRVFEWAMSATCEEDGEVDGVIFIGIDVTDRVRTVALERVLGVIDVAVLSGRSIQEVFELTCAQASEDMNLAAVWVAAGDTSADGVIRAAAGAAAPVLMRAIESDSLVGLPIPLLAPPPVALSLRDLADRLGEQALAVLDEQGIIDVTWSPIQVRDELVGAVGAFHTRSEEAAGVSQALSVVAARLGTAYLLTRALEEARLHSAALEAAASAIVIIEVDGSVRWANPAFYGLTGYTPDEVVGASILSEGRGYREPGYVEAWEVVRAGWVWHGELTNRTRDGQEYLEEVTLAPVKDEVGRVTHVVVVKTDAGERGRFEQLRSDFVAMVSHELRSPLTTIIGYSDLLSSAMGLEQERAAEALKGIRASGERMREIVEELLAVNEMRAEGVKVSPHTVDVGALVRDIAHQTVDSPRHRLTLSVSEGMPPASVDPRAIGHALRNLLSNAVKYSPDGGEVNVDVDREGDVLVIRVTDQGVGIPDKEITRLMGAFTQQDMSTTRQFGGVGLGLFVANMLVKAHGGEICIDSSEGEGSTFEIRLPFAGVRS